MAGVNNKEKKSGLTQTALTALVTALVTLPVGAIIGTVGQYWVTTEEKRLQVLLMINVHLRISQTRNQLEAIIMMVADEHRPDWTTAAGSTGWIPVYAAPPGRIIAYLIDINGNRTNEIVDWVGDYFTTYSCCKPFLLPGQRFVNNYFIVADTDGNEAGSRTGVSVFFRPVKVGLQVLY